MKWMVFIFLGFLTSAASAYELQCKSRHSNGYYQITVLDDLDGNAFMYFDNYYQGARKNGFGTRLGSRQKTELEYRYPYVQNTLRREMIVYRDATVIKDKSLDRYSTEIVYDKCEILSETNAKDWWAYMMKEYPEKTPKL